MQRSRYELKYRIDERRARGVRDFIRGHLVRDSYARPQLGGSYPIYSIYLDSPSLHLFNATVSGHKNRFKLRARYYDPDPNSPVFFEIKRRVNDVILKERAAVKRGSVSRLLVGGPPAARDLHEAGDPRALHALSQFCHLRDVVNAGGRTIVGYTREAWNAPGDDDVRVTFDRKLAGSWFDPLLPIDQALRVDRAWTYPPVEDGGVVLELKFTGRYPLWMRELVASFDLYRTCMAKYVACVEAMGPRGHGLFRGRRRDPLRRIETLV